MKSKIVFMLGVFLFCSSVYSTVGYNPYQRSNVGAYGRSNTSTVQKKPIIPVVESNADSKCNKKNDNDIDATLYSVGNKQNETLGTSLKPQVLPECEMTKLSSLSKSQTKESKSSKDGVDENFRCFMKLGGSTTKSSNREGTVTWKNTGSTGVSAPYVRVSAGEGVLIRLTDADAWGKSIEFIATSASSPVSMLKAGEEGSLVFLCQSESDDDKLELSWTLSSAKAFPWSELGASLKPSYVSQDAWTFALSTLKARLGATWDTYLARLRANADYLAGLGRPVNRIDRLMQVEVARALGIDAALPVIDSATDAARSARGIFLAFSRTYSSAMYSRFSSGILGYGWTDNYSAYAELTDEKTLVFCLPGGGSYSFSKEAGSWQPEDARDKTVLTESSSAYTLTYQNGTVQTFAKLNMRTASIADNSGNTVTFIWDGTILKKVAHTDGQSLTFAYSGGLLSSVTDDCGRKTQYTYSNLLLTKVTSPNGLTVSFEYRPVDNTAASRALSRIIYPDGTAREFSYDILSGQVTEVSVNGGKEKVTIDRADGVITMTSGDGAVTKIKTGVSGEVLETVDALGGVTAQEYTEDGLLKAIVSPSGLTGSITHDALGRVSKSVSASGTATAFSYKSTFGNLKTVTDAKNHAITYGYDAKGRGTSVSFVDGSASRLEYNSRGDVVKSINRRGEYISYLYDSKGCLTKKNWSNGRTFTYSYDARGNVTAAADSATGTVRMEYDSADRVTRIMYPTGRGFTFTYDSCGRLSVRTSHDGAAEHFSYDASGRLASVSDGNGTVYLSNMYDATTGRLTRQSNGNGTSVSYLYDKLGRVVSIEHCDADGKIVESFQYCYDADGRCIRASSLFGEERYGYDNDGQLTSVEYPDGADETFSYDAVGNRTGRTGGSPAENETYAVNNLNQYTEIVNAQAARSTMTYDRDGNMTAMTDSQGTTRYYYDTLNRLVAVTNATKNIRWSCVYDVFGNRVSVTDNGVTTERTYLQGALPSVAAEYVNGQLKKRYILVGAVRVADLITNNSSLTTKYYHADLIGSTRLVSDGNGAIVDRRAYKTFGETRIGEESVCGYVGTLGVETDSTGLLFMRNRYYSPSLGRFIQMDPIGQNSGDVNIYRYCNNNGLQSVDPDGFEVLETIALMFDVDMTDPNAAPGLLGPSVTVAAPIVSSDSVAKMAERGTVALLVKETPSTALGVSYSNLGRKLIEVPASAVKKAGIVKSGVKRLGKAGTVWAWGSSAYDNLYKKFDVRQFLADGVTGMYKGWFQIGSFAGYWATKGGIKIYKWLKPDKTIVVNVADSGSGGGSGGGGGGSVGRGDTPGFNPINPNTPASDGGDIPYSNLEKGDASKNLISDKSKMASDSFTSGSTDKAAKNDNIAKTDADEEKNSNDKGKAPESVTVDTKDDGGVGVRGWCKCVNNDDDVIAVGFGKKTSKANYSDEEYEWMENKFKTSKLHHYVYFICKQCGRCNSKGKMGGDGPLKNICIFDLTLAAQFEDEKKKKTMSSSDHRRHNAMMIGVDQKLLAIPDGQIVIPGSCFCLKPDLITVGLATSDKFQVCRYCGRKWVSAKE